MALILSYFFVVLIWATTPLAIQWSSDSLTFILAGAARMVIALAVALLIHALLRQSLNTYWQHRAIYFAASIGIFPNMPVVYWGIQFIPSGLAAVLFAMTPFAAGLMTLLLLKQNPFTARRVIALLMAMAGLVTIFYHQLKFDVRSIYGFVAMLISCVLLSFSSVWVKKLTQENAVSLNAFHQASGALIFSVPGMLLCWWFMDGTIPHEVSTKSAVSVVYLAVIGSLIGGALFFYILQRMSACAVSLITLMTPVLAIVLGKTLANEEMSSRTLIGVAVVLSGLLLYLPWNIRGAIALINAWMLRKMAEPPAYEGGTSLQQELQKIKEYVIRFK